MRIEEQYDNLSCYKEQQVIRYGKNGMVQNQKKQIMTENHLRVYVNECMSFEMICTPIDLAALILGHIYTEGIISNVADVESISVGEDGTSASVFLLNRNEAVSLPQGISTFRWEAEWICQLAEAFKIEAPIYEKTHGSHSCFLAHKGEIIYLCEDIGRHNALDKAIGKALINNIDLRSSILYISGRIPIDMIQKVIRSKVPLVASNTVPTVQSVELAKKHNVTLIGITRDHSFFVFHDGSHKKWKKVNKRLEI